LNGNNFKNESIGDSYQILTVIQMSDENQREKDYMKPCQRAKGQINEVRRE
jgi:hypothetical protein